MPIFRVGGVSVYLGLCILLIFSLLQVVISILRCSLTCIGLSIEKDQHHVMLHYEQNQMTYYDKSDLSEHFTMHFDVSVHGAALQMLSSCWD